VTSPPLSLEVQDTTPIRTTLNGVLIRKTPALTSYVDCYRNGPVGSAVCVYSFDSGDSLVSVFLGKYLRETTLDQFEEVENTDPFSVSTNDTHTHTHAHTQRK
jgi:hypothetical protein